MNIVMILGSVLTLLFSLGFIFVVLAEKVRRWDNIFYWLANACGYVLVGSIFVSLICASIYGIIKGFGFI